MLIFAFGMTSIYITYLFICYLQSSYHSNAYMLYPTLYYLCLLKGERMSKEKSKLYFKLEGEKTVKAFMAVKKELGLVSNLNVLRFLVFDRYEKISQSIGD